MKYLGKRAQSSSPDTMDKNARSSGLGLFVSPSYSIRRFTIGCAFVSIGILVSAIGGSWDISNHLLNKPETFFSAPHAVLYTGVAVAILGLANVRVARASRSIWEKNLNLSARLTLAGIGMLIVAAPIDFAWHSAFGLDGLLSPPHLVLLIGMILSSLRAMLGIISYTNSAKVPILMDDEKAVQKKDLTKLGPGRLNPHMLLLIIIGVLPIWMTLDGVIGM